MAPTDSSDRPRPPLSPARSDPGRSVRPLGVSSRNSAKARAAALGVELRRDALRFIGSFGANGL
jgi:hypothetical protein